MNPNVELPNEIFKESVKYLDSMYKYQIEYIFNLEEFYDQLKPKIRQMLSFECLKLYYIKFKEFFFEPILGFQA